MEAALDALGYDIEKQLWLLLYSVILGAVLGALFDLFRILRVFLTVKTEARPLKAASDAVLTSVSFIGDILFFVISAVCVVLFCFQANRGCARGFILFGIAVGFAFYLLTIGRLTRLISNALSQLLWRFIGFVYGKIIMPILRVLLKVAKRIYKITLGRAVTAVSVKLKKYTTARKRARAVRLRREQIMKTKGIRDEPGSAVNTGKARNTPRVPVYDNHPRQHSDSLQQSGGRTGKAERAHRRCAGKH